MMPLALDRISITLLMDNYTDRLLPSSAIAKRAPMVRDEQILPAPIAEQGFSAMIRIQIGQHQQRFLFDTGVSRRGMLANADLFGVPLDGVEAIILSHGHFDHFAGLAAALPRIGSPTKLVLHPDAFLRHRPLFPDGSRATMPYMDEEELKRRGAMISKNSGPTALPSKENPCLMVTGEIPRRTSQEIGFPLQHAGTEDGLVHDPPVRDDQALVANLKNKGLVIPSGCGHAGIINTIDRARKLAGTEKINAVVGGFHLTGPMYEGAIEPTLKAMEDVASHYIVPCHCTGWKAINRIVQLFPEEFIQPSVGTTLDFYTEQLVPSLQMSNTAIEYYNRKFGDDKSAAFIHLVREIGEIAYAIEKNNVEHAKLEITEAAALLYFLASKYGFDLDSNMEVTYLKKLTALKQTDSGMAITLRGDLDSVSLILRETFELEPFKRDYDLAFGKIAKIIERYGIAENPRNLRFRFILCMQEFFDGIPQDQWRVKDPAFVRQSEEFAIAQFREWIIEQVT